MRNTLDIFWNRLIASDPGLARLGLAARATGTAVLALGLAGTLRLVGAWPVPAVLLCVVVAMLSAMMVNDGERRQRRITTLLLPVPAAIAITLGAFLADFRIISDGVFVAIVFAAVYARRFGPRGFAFGMLAFITYFFALFLHARFSQLPDLLTAVALGAGCAYVMRFWIVPDWPQRRVQAQLRALYARTARVLDGLIERVEGHNAGGRAQRVLRARLVQLNEAALLVEGTLEEQGMAEPSETTMSSPALAIFELELAVERVVAAGLETQATETTRSTASDRRTAVIDALRQLRQDTVQRHLRRPAEFEPSPAAIGDRWAVVLQALADALVNAPDTDSATRLVPPRVPTQDDAAATVEAEQTKATEASHQPWLRPTTRQAIQVSIAAALAIVAGELVSPQRWYWAAITAFVVFAGTSTRGETLAKGWQRVAGTLAGVLAGIGLALAVGAQHGLSVVLIFICMFLAFYCVQISYGLMMFWITILLALLYGLIGMFSVHLLTLRLEETALGAAIGVAVASLVIPARTRSSVREASQDYLKTLDTLVQTCVQRLTDGASRPDPMPEARRVDRAFQQLRTAARPLTRDVAGAFGRRSARRWVRAMLTGRNYGRHLARIVQHTPAFEDGSPLPAALRETAAHIGRTLEALRSTDNRPDARHPFASSDALDRAAAALRDAEPNQLAAARLLRRLDRLAVDLVNDFGTRTGRPRRAAGLKRVCRMRRQSR